MSRHERLAAANLNRSPKSMNKHLPDSTWKAQQAFIRATRRGSKKHTAMPEKLALLDAATSAIPAPTKLEAFDLTRKRLAEESAAIAREHQTQADEMKRRATPLADLATAAAAEPRRELASLTAATMAIPTPTKVK